MNIKNGLLSKLDFINKKETTSMELSQNYMYYTASDSKSAYYLFDPMRNPQIYKDPIMKVVKYEGPLLSCIHSFLMTKQEPLG